MHNKDLNKADTRCQKSIIDNVGCAFCRGVKRCELYPQDVDKLMEFKNKTWQQEWNLAHPEEGAKKLKHKSLNNRQTEVTQEMQA